MLRSALRSFLPLATPRRLIPPAALLLVVLGMLALGWAGRSLAPVQAAPTDCSTGDFIPTTIENDTTLSGELFVTDHVTIRDGAALTLTAGAHVTMCGPYQIWVQDARLLALGTETAPVTVSAQDPNTPWRRIYIGGGGVAVQESVLRHLIVEDGGQPPTDNANTGAIDIDSPDISVNGGPVLDHVTVRNSRRYGIYIRMNEDDADPLSLTNLTVTGSAQAPLMLYVSAMRGMGGGHSLTGNGEDVIEVRAGTVGGGTVHFDQRWLAHDVPYKVVSDFGGITLSGDNDPILTIDPGAILLMDEGANIWVQDGGLVAEGTADDPITFTRPDETSQPWERIYIDDRFSESESRLSHVNVSYAGYIDGAIYLQDGVLSIDNATIQHNSGPGVTATSGSFLEIADSTIDANDVGVEFRVGSRGMLRRNTLTNNSNGAVVNDDSRGSCVDAMGNYWGSADGPADPSAELDDCNLTATNDGAGDAVSDNVLYDPWLTGPPADAEASASSISPDPFWVIANGADSATVTVTLRGAAGDPLPDKAIMLQTTRGEIQQPAAPTDENGVATAVITSTETGGAIITARNVTDGQPLDAMAAVYFWQGGDESAGLIDPGGVPYVAPQLEMDGQPFEQGFPMTFRLPMQNSNPVEATVVVTYSVSGLGIGASFTPVAVVSDTLAPAQAWDAEASWIPDVTGHHCLRATATVTLPDTPANAPAVNVNVGPWQINFDLPDDPCKEIDVNKLIPNSGGLSGVRKHVTRGVVQAYLTNECINSHLGGGARTLSPAQIATSHRAYEEIVTPPAYTPPPFEAGDGVTPEQAAAANGIVESAFRLAALDEARLVTAERIRAAGQAGDEQAAARQREAYNSFHRDVADELEIFADAIDAYLALTRDEGVPDTTFLPADYQAYLTDIQDNGYDAETVTFHQAAGLPSTAIEIIRQAEIARLEEQPPVTASFYRFLADVAGQARRLALELENDYVIVGTGGRRAAPLQTGPDDPLSATFIVGNPTDSDGTVDLLVRPVNVPLNWSYSLDNPAPSLDPGETTTVTLTINPAGGQATGRTVQLAVEGFIGDDYVGGILFERFMEAVRYDLHLPAVLGE